LLPCGKRREAGCDPRVGQLPKSTKIWPGGDWHGADWPREISGFHAGKTTAKVGLKDVDATTHP